MSSNLSPPQGDLSHLHDLILQLQEVVDNLVLLDGQGVQVDLLHALDLAGLDETAELGDGLPLLLLRLAAATSTATASSTTAVSASGAETTASGAAGGSASSTISHGDDCAFVLRVCEGVAVISAS